ncbi:uncharacterized protein LOC130445278 [Diorhabda sublineata]|uniref:uncharacterized protein LOC130445278 n=1 Tax=Diorhabda sublineata TaxID=1163346 RepID=UPI0024E169EB|nr:uncharacterized protein LOC130445278 [Diorhabda sublineata]
MIKDLTTLLSDKFIPKKVVGEPKISRLLAKGENFGSEMLKVDFVLEDEQGTREEMYAVAKILPESELFRNIFNVQVTYTNEMAFYEVIVPTLQQFQKSLGIKEIIDCFPKCYATRKNILGNSDTITNDAVIILENLQVLGFRNWDKRAGLDLDTTKLILRDLALLHGVSLALKIKDPNTFEEKIKRYCVPYNPSHHDIIPILKLIIEENKDLAHLSEKYVGWGLSPLSPINEPFACLTHTDLWTNNTMQKLVDGKATLNKLVDFQVYQYGSPATDIFFFLWSSVKQDVLEGKLDYLLEYYHGALLEVLQKHHCDVDRFSFQIFLDEMQSVSKYEFGHAFMFHNLIVNVKEGGYDLEKSDVNSIYQDVPLNVKEKSWFMLRECVKRGWY